MVLLVVASVASRVHYEVLGCIFECFTVECCIDEGSSCLEVWGLLVARGRRSWSRGQRGGASAGRHLCLVFFSHNLVVLSKY